ncbi:MAG TPA: transporter [Polyangiaceae bacterium]|nr:transporter [Polyangiaceae bacterium]
MKNLQSGGAALFVFSISIVAHAETDPRDYAAIAGTKTNSIVTLGYARAISTSDASNLSQTLGIVRALYLVKFGNLALLPFDALVPMADVTVYSQPTPPGPFRASGVVEHASGLADLTYLPTVAYVVPEGEGTNTTIAASFYLTVPTGTYDSSKVVNIGNHRWAIQPQLAVAQRYKTAFTAEAVGYAVFYTDNSAFQPPAMLPLQTVKQNPTFGLDLHLAYNPNPTGFIALSYYLAANGRSYFDPTVNGQVVAPEADKTPQQTIHTLRFTYGWRFEKESLVLFQFNQDILAKGTDASISRFVGARFSHTFEL